MRLNNKRMQGKCADEAGLSPSTNGLGFIVKPMHQLNMNNMLGGGIKRKKGKIAPGRGHVETS